MQKMPFESIVTCSNLAGKYVFLRSSINVPIVDGVVQNQFRITRALATVRYLTSKGARVILAGHVGREGDMSTKPIADIFSTHFETHFSPKVLGVQTQQLRDELKNGEVLVLENLRSDVREKQSDTQFAQDLASLADVYVNDAFAASHREHASLVGVPQFLPSYAGLNFVHEYQELIKALTPRSPSLFLLGGAKFDTKLPLVEKFLDIYDTVFIGGALANDFFKAKGYEVGTSLVSSANVSGSSLLNHTNILLPIDVIVEKGGVSRVVTPQEVHKDERIVDAGPDTAKRLDQQMQSVRMVLWNGPLGDYEHGFVGQTSTVAKSIAQSDGYSIVGGGDTIAAIEKLNCQEKYNFLSTAGGAMLTFLELGTLPAIEALKGALQSE